MMKFKTVDDILRAYENAQFESYLKTEEKYLLSKNIKIGDAVRSINVCIWRGESPIVEINFPEIGKKDGSVITKSVTHSYTKTEKGLIPISTNFSDKGFRSLRAY